MAQNITHDRIMQLATGFCASKTFLSAVELGVFGSFVGHPDFSSRFEANVGCWHSPAERRYQRISRRSEVNRTHRRLHSIDANDP